MDDIVLWTNDDVDLLARLITAEAQGEPFAGQLAVATVVVNRFESDEYPNCLPDIIYQPNQFAVPAKAASDSCIKAANTVLIDGYRSFANTVDMFQRKKESEWHGRKWVCQIDKHNFYGR